MAALMPPEVQQHKNYDAYSRSRERIVMVTLATWMLQKDRNGCHLIILHAFSAKKRATARPKRINFATSNSDSNLSPMAIKMQDTSLMATISCEGRSSRHALRPNITEMSHSLSE